MPKGQEQSDHNSAPSTTSNSSVFSNHHLHSFLNLVNIAVNRLLSKIPSTSPYLTTSRNNNEIPIMFEYLLLGLITITFFTIVPVPVNIFKKALLWLKGIKYTITSKDLPSKCTQSNVIEMVNYTPSNRGTRIMRVIFVRHGQSVWNSIFNSFGLFWPFRVVKAIFLETWFFLTNPNDSVIFDTPLSAKGFKEAADLASYVRNCKATDLPHDGQNSVIVCSNLRRAMATAAVGLAARLRVTGERIVIDSSLQEGSRNVDAQCLNTTRQKLISTPVGQWKTALQLSTVFDPQFHFGNKSARGNVYTRMDDFVRHIFGGAREGGFVPSASPEEGQGPRTNAELDTVIAVGHSGFIKSFFKRFLPVTSNHPSKNKKIQTGGVVSFELLLNETTGEVSVDEASIKLLYRKFG